MRTMKALLLACLLTPLAALGTFAGGVLYSSPATATPTQPATPPAAVDRQGDAELAYLLVKLELKTRSVIAEHYTRPQSSVPGVDIAYQRTLTKNLLLPAAVAGRIFADTVPEATGGRAWVRMVVERPRNPKNQGDGVALELLAELQSGAKSAERHASDAFYYGESIVCKDWCLRCHGDPAGESDPSFPEYVKDGWKVGDVIGGVIARVAPEK
jgi:hypothetical protein